MKKIISLLLSLAFVFSLTGCSDTDSGSSQITASSDIVSEINSEGSEQPDINQPQVTPEAEITPPPAEPAIDEDGSYFDKENVALYIHTYGKLPKNFITKEEAGKLGWEGGSVEKYAPGCAIGGDRFGNYEGRLPKAKGRTYTECDIDTDGYHSRGSRRIVFSNDGLIYYTHDHYETFELLYGEE